MKQLILIVLLFASSFLAAQNKFVQASDLTLIGKILPTPNPYDRVDTLKYKGFNASENNQMRMSAGIAVLFKTNSKKVGVRAEYGLITYADNTMPIAARGFDMYIRKDGRWLWAGVTCPTAKKENGQIRNIVTDMDDQMKECMVYLPLFSEMRSVEIIVDEDAIIEPMESPFRHRIVALGSSFTHGSSTSRAGMPWPAQFTRNTGLQILGFGCAGNSKLQPHFADVLVDVDADAFIFDSFSNPTAPVIKERLFPFIEKIQAAHPGKPLIFQRTIYRENRNFNTKSRKIEEDKIAMADSLMAIAVKKYKDVYYVYPNATSDNHETSVDGVHPDNYGYSLWEKSIEKPILKILRKYGIK